MKHFQNCTRKVLASFLILLLLPILPGVSCAEDLKVLTLPESLTTIPQEAFRGDTSLQKVILQEGITSIQSRAFADSSVREISLPASLTYIAEDAFENTSIQTLTAPKGCYAYAWGREHQYITEYRALLIGEKTFLRYDVFYEDGIEQRDYTRTEVLRNSNDVSKMAAMLGKVYGPEGGQYKATRKTNAGYYAIQSAIRTTFVDTMEHDISIFFIASHGNSSGDGELEMPFTGDPKNQADRAAYEAQQYLSFETLASWLSVINGKVIVILESCGAGSSIYVEPNGAKRGVKTEDDLSEDFVQAAVKAFASVDPGIVVKQEMEPNSNRKSAGNLRQPKFYVLAAAAHHEESYGYSNTSTDPVNLFTKWLIQGVGEAGNSPADISPQNSILILDELYQYIKSVGDNYKITIQGETYYQHVQVYPENSDQAIFLLK